jgi:hypothetical protein
MGPGPKKSTQLRLAAANSPNNDKDEEETPLWAQKLVVTMEEIKVEVADLRQSLVADLKRVDRKIDTTKAELEQKIEDLEYNSRKYNLLIWGINNTNAQNCEEKVRSFLSSELEIADAADIPFSACHPLQGNTVIVRLARMQDRERILKKTKLLSGKNFSVKTDLPARLRMLRNSLWKQAAGMKKDGRIVRVRERGRDVVLEERRGATWSRVDP